MKIRNLGIYSHAVILAAVFSATAFAAGKPFNPDTSVNFLGLIQQGNQGSNDRNAVSHNGAQLQEAEVQFLSDVDPYLRANALLSISPNGKGDFGIDPEEVFLETTTVPYVTLKAGKFKEALGKHNQLHTHAFPFIDAPLIHQRLLGDEGLNESGVSAATLIPVSWFMEVTVQGVSNNNATLYGSPSAGDFAEVAHLKNLFDLTDDLTMESGFSGTQGPNQWGSKSNVFGADLTFKWRPAEGGKYKAIIWSTEYLDGKLMGKPTGSTLGGIASWVQYQFAERWWVQGRYEFVGLPRSSDITTQNKQSALLAFFPSEFSGFRIQYDHLAQKDLPAGHNIAFQYNITIGAHPAHAY